MECFAVSLSIAATLTTAATATAATKVRSSIMHGALGYFVRDPSLALSCPGGEFYVVLLVFDGTVFDPAGRVLESGAALVLRRFLTHSNTFGKCLSDLPIVGD